MRVSEISVIYIYIYIYIKYIDYTNLLQGLIIQASDT